MLTATWRRRKASLARLTAKGCSIAKPQHFLDESLSPRISGTGARGRLENTLAAPFLDAHAPRYMAEQPSQQPAASSDGAPKFTPQPLTRAGAHTPAKQSPILHIPVGHCLRG